MREAFLVFLSLTVMAIFNVGLLWEEQKISLRYVNSELTQMLQLSSTQLEKIRSVQAEYEAAVSKLTERTGATGETRTRLMQERNRQIAEVLNERQKRILHTYCTDLVSFAKMFE